MPNISIFNISLLRSTNSKKNITKARTEQEQPLQRIFALKSVAAASISSSGCQSSMKPLVRIFCATKQYSVIADQNIKHSVTVLIHGSFLNLLLQVKLQPTGCSILSIDYMYSYLRLQNTTF